MKKALLCGLSAALLLALVLVACNKPQADQPTEPDPTPTPSAVQTQPAETNEPVNQVEQMSVNTQQKADTLRLATDEELLKIFNDTYEFGQSFANTGYSEEDVLEQELNQLNFIMGMMADFRAPDDLEVRYLTWRVLNHSQEPEATEAPASNPQQASNITSATTQTGTTGGTTQTNPGTTNNQQGGLTQQPSTGDLGVDVTGGKSPMDFLDIDDGTEAKDSGGYLDMSKVGFGN